jgi:hypothetical protein
MFLSENMLTIILTLFKKEYYDSRNISTRFTDLSDRVRRRVLMFTKY